MAINLNNNEIVKEQISIRVDSTLVKDVNDVVKTLKDKFKIKISRNVILEEMLKEARESITFIIDGEEYTFSDVLKNREVTSNTIRDIPNY